MNAMIKFNDSYNADGFVAGVAFINEHLESFGLKVVEEFIDDDTIEEEFPYKLTVKKLGETQ
jgi:hypothetical protein